MHRRIMRTGLTLSSIAALAALAACGSSSDSGEAGDGDRTYKMVLIPGTTSAQFYLSMRDGAMAEAKKLGVDLEFQGVAEFSPAAQTPIVNALAAKSPDAVIIAPTDPEALFAPLRSLEQAGAKIVTVDTTLKDTSIVTSAITSDNAQGGALAADTIAKIAGKDAKVAVIGLTPSATTINERVDGLVKQAEAEYPDMEVLPTQFSGDQASKAQTDMQALLLANPDIDAVFAPSQPGSEGAAAAAKAEGIEDQLTVVGYDSSESQVALLESGQVDALVLQQPAKEGALGVRAAYEALTGKTPEKTNVLENVLALTSNATDPEIVKYFY